jgi:hypothetical protein
MAMGLQTYDAGYLFYLNIIDITALETGGCVITGSNSTDSCILAIFLFRLFQ